MRILKVGCFVVFFILLGPVVSAFDLEMQGRTLTVHARQVPLQAILKKIVSQGVTVRIDPAINPLVSIDLDQKELEAGLRLLLKSVNHALDWQIRPDGSGLFDLTVIRVFRAGRQDLMQNLTHDSHLLDVARDTAAGFYYVRGELLVRLRPGFDAGDLGKLLAPYPASWQEIGPAGLYRIIFLNQSDVLALLVAFRSLPAIASVEPNFAHPVSLPARAEQTAPIAWRPATPVNDTVVGVAVLDSGLSFSPKLKKVVTASLDTLEPNKEISDTLGHGTQMAYLASGLVNPLAGVSSSPEVTVPVVSVRVFDDRGFTANHLIVEALDFAHHNGAKVVSMSWGSETPSILMEELFGQAAAEGMVLIASAGNEPTGLPVYPAAYPTVIGVGALQPDGQPWPKSNYGEFVSCVVPGFADLPVGYGGEPGLYAGTSISAAFLAHEVAALWAEQPNLTREEIISTLKKSSPKQ